MDIGQRAAASVPALVQETLEISHGLEGRRPLWYRGQTCSGFALLPKLMRDAPSIEAAFDRERRLLTRFRQRSLPFWPSGYPQDDWEHMFAMQHNGVPTRLLDWSENLFVALYFAVEHLPANHEDPALHDVDACEAVIWVLDPIGWNRSVPQLKDYGTDITVLTTGDVELEPYTPDRTRTFRLRNDTPVAIYGTHNTERIVAQRGTFTVHGKNVQSMDSLAAPIEGPTALWRLSLGTDRNPWQAALSTLGFTESMIFPDLPGISRELGSSEGWPT